MIILEWHLKLNTEQNMEKELRVLTPKQMLQRLPVAPAQVEAGKPSENLLNEICQIMYFCIEQKK